MLEGAARLGAILVLCAAVDCELRAAAGGGQAMRIPFDAEADSCYREIKKAPVLGPGFDHMLEAARREGNFEARLKDVQGLRKRLVEEYRAKPQRSEAMREESLFVCAANDLLEAMFSAEGEKLASLSGKERASGPTC